jgi:hypothetical protein
MVQAIQALIERKVRPPDVGDRGGLCAQPIPHPESERATEARPPQPRSRENSFVMALVSSSVDVKCGALW